MVSAEGYHELNCKAMKKRNSKELLRNMRTGELREEQKSQGFFDGRFVSRSIPSKKLYTRKQKHKEY